MLCIEKFYNTRKIFIIVINCCPYCVYIAIYLKPAMIFEKKVKKKNIL